MDKTQIIRLLQTNDRAIARALIALNQRQTATEQSCESTINHNGVGFTPADARMGTSMADFFTRRGYLTEKQLAYWKRPNRKGTWRICKYAGQLLSIAKERASIAAERAMQQAEAEADRAQTLQDESAKFAARQQMETV